MVSLDYEQLICSYWKCLFSWSQNFPNPVAAKFEKTLPTFRDATNCFLAKKKTFEQRLQKFGFFLQASRSLFSTAGWFGDNETRSTGL